MIVWLAALLGTGFLVGQREVRAFERKAAEDIRAQLQGDLKSVTIRTKLDPFRAAGGRVDAVKIEASHFSTPGLPLFTEPDRGQKGKLGRLDLELTDFALNGLRVERLAASIPNCRFDFDLAVSKRQVRLSRSGVGNGSVEVLATDLTPFILRKFREIKRVQVIPLPDKKKIRVEGFGEFIVVQTNFVVEADLVSPDGRTLALSNAEISFDGRPADPFSAKTLLDTLNPVVDFQKDLNLLDAVKVENVEITAQGLIARGRTQIPIHPNQRWKPGQWILPHVRVRTFPL